MRVYSFANTVMLVNGVEITGWAKGDDVIDISRRTDGATDQIGAGGQMMVSLSADKSGEIKFKLQATSSSNRFLSNLSAQQDGGTSSFVPVQIKFLDTYRQDLADGTVGYIKKHADIKRGGEAGDSEWVIVVENLFPLLGDQADVAA